MNSKLLALYREFVDKLNIKIGVDYFNIDLYNGREYLKILDETLNDRDVVKLYLEIKDIKDENREMCLYLEELKKLNLRIENKDNEEYIFQGTKPVIGLEFRNNRIHFFDNMLPVNFVSVLLEYAKLRFYLNDKEKEAKE